MSGHIYLFYGCNEVFFQAPTWKYCLSYGHGAGMGKGDHDTSAGVRAVCLHQRYGREVLVKIRTMVTGKNITAWNSSDLLWVGKMGGDAGVRGYCDCLQVNVERELGFSWVGIRNKQLEIVLSLVFLACRCVSESSFSSWWDEFQVRKKTFCVFPPNTRLLLLPVLWEHLKVNGASCFRVKTEGFDFPELHTALPLNCHVSLGSFQVFLFSGQLQIPWDRR